MFNYRQTQVSECLRRTKSSVFAFEFLVFPSNCLPPLSASRCCPGEGRAGSVPSRCGRWQALVCRPPHLPHPHPPFTCPPPGARISPKCWRSVTCMFNSFQKHGKAICQREASGSPDDRDASPPLSLLSPPLCPAAAGPPPLRSAPLRAPPRSAPRRAGPFIPVPSRFSQRSEHGAHTWELAAQNQPLSAPPPPPPCPGLFRIKVAPLPPFIYLFLFFFFSSVPSRKR